MPEPRNDYNAFEYRFEEVLSGVRAETRSYATGKPPCFCCVIPLTFNLFFFFSFSLCFQDVEHADVLTVGFELDGMKRILDLRLNVDLIPVGYQQRHQHRGTYKVHTPAKVVSTVLSFIVFCSIRFLITELRSERVDVLEFFVSVF